MPNQWCFAGGGRAFLVLGSRLSARNLHQLSTQVSKLTQIPHKDLHISSTKSLSNHIQSSTWSNEDSCLIPFHYTQTSVSQKHHNIKIHLHHEKIQILIRISKSIFFIIRSFISKTCFLFLIWMRVQDILTHKSLIYNTLRSANTLVRSSTNGVLRREGGFSVLGSRFSALSSSFCVLCGDCLATHILRSRSRLVLCPILDWFLSPPNSKHYTRHFCFISFLSCHSSQNLHETYAYSPQIDTISTQYLHKTHTNPLLSYHKVITLTPTLHKVITK